ncbi:MAG TPA: DUF1657 domain-containing protein [Spirochaetia bacterium]|nr:DUF1657 domain-containing protein [Spirochaetia bacterium]
MTIASNVKQTLASLKGAQATIETFASLEKNAENREVLDRSARQIAGVVTAMEKRTGFLEFAEPQYKGF